MKQLHSPIPYIIIFHISSLPQPDIVTGWTVHHITWHSENRNYGCSVKTLYLMVVTFSGTYTNSHVFSSVMCWLMKLLLLFFLFWGLNMKITKTAANKLFNDFLAQTLPVFISQKYYISPFSLSMLGFSMVHLFLMYSGSVLTLIYLTLMLLFHTLCLYTCSYTADDGCI